jgi:hypothetical protein
MPKGRRYWELIEPLFESVQLEDSASFFRSIKDVNRPPLLMFAAHFCLSELHNGGLLQFFWNSTGIIAPEAVEGFEAMGMPQLASIVSKAASLLGTPYPREREDRWDALLAASGRTEEELQIIFEQNTNFYLGFNEATRNLNFDFLSDQAMKFAQSENGDFGNAATQYASSLNLFI